MQEPQKCCACVEARSRELEGGVGRGPLASSSGTARFELPDVVQTIGNSISSEDFR